MMPQDLWHRDYVSMKQKLCKYQQIRGPHIVLRESGRQHTMHCTPKAKERIRKTEFYKIQTTVGITKINSVFLFKKCLY